MENAPISQASHTRVPNLVEDVVKPLLSPAENICLSYIIRRTIGYADPSGGRKARDTIALEQFENGQTMGNYLRNLGTGLSLNTIKKALEGLEDKLLVEVRYSCTCCLWEQEPGDPSPPTIDEKAPTPQCPRCRRTLSRSWALGELTPRKLIDLLNAHDRQGRRWQWDGQRKLFYFEEQPEQEQKRKQSQEDLRQEALRLWRLLWFRELVDQAAVLAEKQLKAGRKLTLTRRINNFYAPVYRLQEEYNNPALIRYALEQTLSGPALRRTETRGWINYMTAVCRSNAAAYAGKAVAEGTNAAAEAKNSIQAREAAMRELLRQAYAANKSNDTEAARALLSDILSQTQVLAELFDNNEQRCELALREAFKQGATDFVGISPNARAPVNYYPEWEWPADVRP